MTMHLYLEDAYNTYDASNFKTLGRLTNAPQLLLVSIMLGLGIRKMNSPTR